VAEKHHVKVRVGMMLQRLKTGDPALADEDRPIMKVLVLKKLARYVGPDGATDHELAPVDSRMSGGAYKLTVEGEALVTKHTDFELHSGTYQLPGGQNGKGCSMVILATTAVVALHGLAWAALRN
jgi:hypothetical protein